jgi:hypothetical protein
MRGLRFIFIDFQSLEVTYYLIFEGFDVSGVFFLRKNEWFGRYRRLGVLGLHECFNLISLFILGFWNDLTPFHFWGFWLSWCVYFSLIFHHLENMESLTLEWMVDFIFLIEYFMLLDEALWTLCLAYWLHNVFRGAKFYLLLIDSLVGSFVTELVA